MSRMYLSAVEPAVGALGERGVGLRIWAFGAASWGMTIAACTPARGSVGLCAGSVASQALNAAR